jgi:ATP-dependent Lon protease
VRWIDQVLQVALERVPQALPEEEPAKDVQKPAEGAPVTAADVLPH